MQKIKGTLVFNSSMNLIQSRFLNSGSYIIKSPFNYIDGKREESFSKKVINVAEPSTGFVLF